MRCFGSNQNQTHLKQPTLTLTLTLDCNPHAIAVKVPSPSNEEELFLINPYGLMFDEITAGSLVKVRAGGEIVDPGNTQYG